MIITREKGMRMWGGGSGSTSASGVNGGGGFSLAVEEGEGTGNAYTGFTYESGVLSLIKGEKFVTVDFFNRLFTAYDSDGNAILPNDVTSMINNLKLLVGTWTEEYLSALGKNSEGGGGGGGIELSDVWQSLKTNTDDYANQKINSAHIPDLSGTYATKTWVNQQGFVTSSGVTSVAMTVPTGLAISGSPITSTGTLALTFATGYSIPTTAKQSNWDTAYGWGNHATAGYATASSVTTLQGYFTNGVAKVAAKLNTGTTTYTAWGQTYWSSGVPQSISGNMTSVGSITPSANGNALGTTSARFNIYGTAGNFSGNVSIGGTLGVTGATTLSSTLSVASGITLTTTKKIYFGDTSHYLELNSTGFHFSHGVYSDSFVSALGANSSGGGGGGVDLDAMWASLMNTVTDTYASSKIATAHIPNLAASIITSGTLADARIPSLAASKITSGTFDTARIPNLSASKITSGTFAAARIPVATASAVGGIKVGTTLAISDGILNQKSGIATAGTYRSVTVDTYGRVTAGTNPTTLSGYGITNAYTKTEVNNALSGYLPLSGGTLTGNVTFNAINKGIYLTDSNGDTYAAIINNAENLWIGARAATDIHHAGNTYISAGSGSAYINRLANSARANYLILDSGNYSSYALPLSGGQMTGHLTWKDTTALPKTTTPLFMLTMDRFDDGGTTRYANLEDVTVGKATTLETSRTIWGQPFDGSANITGALSSVTSITMSSHINMNNNTSIKSNDTDGTTRAIVSYNSSNHLILGYDVPASGGSTFIYGTNIGFRTNGTGTANQAMYITSEQNVGIGTTTPGYKLGVVGTVGISGDIYLHNTGTIYAKDSTDTDRSILAFTSSNQLILGSGVPAAGGSTYIMGNTIDIRAGGAAASNRTIYITAAQNVGIGTTSPSQKLHVVGNILASGEVTASSDERKKNIISNTKFNVRDIASARSIIYEWNDDRDKDNEKKIHGGSIAQDWLGKADSFLSQDNDGWYSINYGALALCSAITIAREVVKHDDEITRLKKEVVKLRERVAELEERRIA